MLCVNLLHPIWISVCPISTMMPTLSSPFSFFWTPQHEYKHKHPWEAHPDWDSNPADLAVVSEECRSSFHHPTVSPCKTYTHIHGPAEVPSLEKSSPSVKFEPTSAGTATSEHCLRQPCGHRAT
jgi:hypothetical protein